MTTESNATDIVGDEEDLQVDAKIAEQAAKTGQSLEEQLQYLKNINADLIKTRDAAKRKSREVEKEAETNKTLAATLKEKLVSKITTDSLRAELTKAGALSVDTALKLVDKSKLVISDDYELDTKSVEALVAELQKSDSVLFKPAEAEQEDKSIKHPNPKRSGEVENIATAYSVAMKAAKSQSQVDAVMRQFGKI